MGIHFVSGLPGASKTAFVVGDKLIEEIRNHDRPIICNLALRLHPWVDAGGVARRGLLRTLIDRYGEDFGAEERIIFLTPEECRHFWRVRAVRSSPGGPWEKVVLPLPPDGRFHFDGQYSGCFYVLDEAHEFLPGQTVEKEDMATSKEILSWASQQRRAGDDAYLISQVVVNVSKKVRAVSQDCYWMTNHAKRVMGWFKQPDVWSYRLYASTPPAQGEEHLRKEYVRLNREDVYGMYDTVAGASVAGGKGDIGDRAKGLPWWSVPAAGVAVCLAFVFGFWGIRSALGALSVGRPKTAAVAVTNSPAFNAVVIASPALPSTIPQQFQRWQAAVSSVEPAKKVELPECSGWAKSGELAMLTLADGRTVYGSNAVATVRGVLFDGVEYRLAMPSSNLRAK